MIKNKTSQAPSQLIASQLTTPLGEVFVCADTRHLYILKFTDQNTMQKSIDQLEKKFDTKITPGTNDLITLVQSELTAYFNGTLTQFTIPVQLHGTDFQQKSWDALMQIPYGTTTHYGQQAIVVGNARAFRAVANANSKNPIAIIVPCHRIIKKNGTMCGYNGGVHRKQALLHIEAQHAHNQI